MVVDLSRVAGFEDLLQIGIADERRRATPRATPGYRSMGSQARSERGSAIGAGELAPVPRYRQRRRSPGPQSRRVPGHPRARPPEAAALLTNFQVAARIAENRSVWPVMRSVR